MIRGFSSQAVHLDNGLRAELGSHSSKNICFGPRSFFRTQELRLSYRLQQVKLKLLCKKLAGNLRA